VILASSNPGDLVLDPFFGTGTTGAVAKRWGRHWIGVERNAAYIEIARQRIAQVQPVEINALVGADQHKRSRKRVSPGMLVQAGLVKPGQVVAFDPKGRITATVLQDGRLQYQERQGSIHQIARLIKDAPVNGWQHWYYQDETSGEWLLIDGLRQAIQDEYQLDVAGDEK
jgi:modification methylase